MVRSRSEANLNRILIDLCTSPSIRSKNEHIRNNQRQHHPPLPTLKPIKSNSCSDLTKPTTSILPVISVSLEEETPPPSPSPTAQPETSSLPLSFQRSPLTAKRSVELSPVPIVQLIPKESTGFVVQTPSYMTQTSLSLFETNLINSSVRHHGHRSLANVKSSSLGASPLFSTLSEEDALAEGNRIDQEYPHQFQQSTSNDFLTSSYDVGSLPKHYGLSSTIYDDERDYASTIPRTTGASPYSPSTPLTPRDGAGLTGDKPQKSKSFMSSLKHLTLPRRKHNKNKYDTSMGSQTSSITHLNTPLQSPPTNLTSHSLSSALPGPYPEYFLSNTMESTPIRRSRSISQSFRNLFRSSSKKKAMAARADAMGEFENGTHNYVSDNRSHLSTSVPTSKKLSFLQRRKSKQKAKNQSTNSLSSYDCSRMESVRDTPIRANVGHPVTMTKSLVR
ncbi:unnamed protein product [Adineta ricciae]|uniref:Uncharacterized protein n=1 Tax=Adineta ricciae TaxID=249248 RepID=A0A814ZWM5_ADIRI|nr:unnamed protein product [Adineta ricciae]